MRPLVLSVAIAMATTALPASALTFFEQSFTCPIGGETFRQQMVASSFEAGRFLDLKPYGATLAPWPLAVCPKNGFVIFKEEKDFTAAEKQRLAAFVETPEYKAMVAAETPHFRAARLAREIGVDSSKVAWLLVEATWQVEDDPRYPRYAEAALEALRADTSDNASGPLLVIELLRRLSRFDDAMAALDALPARITDNPNLKRVADYQRELVLARDSAPHKIPLANPPKGG